MVGRGSTEFAVVPVSISLTESSSYSAGCSHRSSRLLKLWFYVINCPMNAMLSDFSSDLLRIMLVIGYLKCGRTRPVLGDTIVGT